MTWLKWLFSWRLHRHDYDLDFEGKGLDQWVFHCKCGDTTKDMIKALTKQGRVCLRRLP